MSDVQFDENSDLGPPPAVINQSKPSGLASKLIEWGVAKTPEQANYVLIGIGIAALVLTLTLLFLNGSSTPVPTNPGLPNAGY